MYDFLAVLWQVLPFISGAIGVVLSIGWALFWRKRNREPRSDLPSRSSGTKRVLFHVLWSVLAPLLGTALIIWLVGTLGARGVPVFASVSPVLSEQAVPIAILVFAGVSSAIGSIKGRLPLARYAFAAVPAGVPEALRGEYEKAQDLHTLGEKLLARKGHTLTAGQRDLLQFRLQTLRSALNATPADSKELASAHEAADGALEARLGAYRKSDLRQTLEQFGVAAVVAVVLRFLVAQPFRIPSGSMIPTLQVNDFIFVSMMSYGPMLPLLDKRVLSTLPPPRGDVIVFAFPEDMRDNFIKRTIGQPGDVIEAKHGHPIINGWEVPSCKVGTYVYEESGTFGDLYMEYLGQASYLTVYRRGQDAYDREGPFRVKAGEVFMMGDNRNDSNDSRRWFAGRGGGVPFDNIAGRAKFVWLSMGNDGSLGRVGSSVQGVAGLPERLSHLRPDVERCVRERPANTTPPAAPPL